MVLSQFNNNDGPIRTDSNQFSKNNNKNNSANFASADNWESDSLENDIFVRRKKVQELQDMIG